MNIYFQRKRIKLRLDQAEELYEEHYGKGFFELLINHMVSGPIDVLLINSQNAVEKLCNIVGPADIEIAKSEQKESLRAQYGQSDLANGVQCSLSEALARKEIKFFFQECKFFFKF